MIVTDEKGVAHVEMGADKANRIAANLNSQDNLWRYEPRELPHGSWVIVVFDEDGFELGYM